jgi:glycosyltransferase involved in cell wall biosynthesis
MECSIVIPAYNAERFVEAAVASALAQQGAGQIEVIVVDDGSSDATAARVAAIDGVRLIRQANAGVSAARNAGLAEAKGEFVIFLDADDELLPDAIRCHREAMAEHPEAVMALGANHIIDESGNRIGSNALPAFETRDFLTVARDVTPCPSQVLLKRATVLAAGGFDAELRGAEDADLWLRVLPFGSVVCHGHFVMNYRKHGSQATRRPSLIFAQHRSMLARRMNDALAPTDAASIKSLEQKWSEHYGQYIPIEVAKLITKGRFAEGIWAAGLFAQALPASARGAIRFARARLAAR